MKQRNLTKNWNESSGRGSEVVEELYGSRQDGSHGVDEQKQTAKQAMRDANNGANVDEDCALRDGTESANGDGCSGRGLDRI